MTGLQSATGILKCDRKLLKIVIGITKCDKTLLQTLTGITKCDKKLLQTVTGITKSDNYYKMRTNNVQLKLKQYYVISVVNE